MKTTRILTISVLALVVGVPTGVAKADFTFGEPTNLGPTINTSSGDGFGCFSSDGLEMYFDSERPGGSGDYDLWVSTRATTGDAWGEPVNLGPTVNTSYLEGVPSLSTDGLTLFFQSDRSGGHGSVDIWITRRATRQDPWGEPLNLGQPVNSGNTDMSPSISTDGLSLFFQSDRPAGQGKWDVWVTMRATVSDPWGIPVNLGPPVNSSSLEQTPIILADGLVLFFSTDRPGGFGRTDLWMATRTTVSEPWAEAVNLGPIVNSSSSEAGANISPDGSSLYFCSNRPGGYGSWDVWQAPIIPIVDFNGDGIVDAADMCIMVEHWGEYYPLCDIGPTPLGDGIVNVEDLKVLAEHLFEEPGLIAYWMLDETEGDIAYDSAGTNDASVLGGPVWQPEGGIVDGAIAFDGRDDYASTDFVLNPANNRFSVFSLIKGVAPGQVVISQTDGVNWLSADPSEGKLMTSLSRPPGGRTLPSLLVSESVITDGAWHRIGFVWDGSYRHLYVDGTEVAMDAEPLSGLESAEGGLHFGAGSTLAPGTFFSGLIDDIRIYNRVVTP